MSTPFLRDETLFRFVFSPDIWGLALNIWVLKGPAFPAKKNITKTKHSQKARQGHIKHVCKISGSISQKWRGHLDFCAVKGKNHGLAS